MYFSAEWLRWVLRFSRYLAAARPCGGEVFKAVPPGAFLFEGADEPLAKPILLGRERCVVFLLEAVVAHESAVGSRAED